MKTMDDKVGEYAALMPLLRNITDNYNVQIALLTEIAKDLRTERMVEARMLAPIRKGVNEQNSSEPATQAQLRKLRFLGVEVSDSISKVEASRLIDRHKEELAAR